MKRVLALTLAACILAVFAIGCNSDGGGEESNFSETGSNESSTIPETSGEIFTEQSAEVPIETNSENDGHCGNDSNGPDGYCVLYDDNCYSISSELIWKQVEIYGEDTVFQWLEAWPHNESSDMNDRVYLFDFIEEFKIPKEVTLECYSNRGGLPEGFVDALYSDDSQFKNKVLVASASFYKNGEIYTPQRIQGMSMDELEDIGISTLDMLLKLPWWFHRISTYRHLDFWEYLVDLFETNGVEYDYTLVPEVVRPDISDEIQEELNRHYNALFVDELYDIRPELCALLGEDGLQITEKWISKKFNGGSDDVFERKTATVLDFVREFDISKEDFTETTEYLYGLDVSLGAIDCLYSDDISLFLGAFVSNNAVYVGGKIYTPKMLRGLSFDEIKALGITEFELSRKMEPWGKDLYSTEFYSEMVELCEANGIEFTKSEEYIRFKESGEEYVSVSETFVECEYEMYFVTN